MDRIHQFCVDEYRNVIGFFSKLRRTRRCDEYRLFSCSLHSPCSSCCFCCSEKTFLGQWIMLMWWQNRPLVPVFVVNISMSWIGHAGVKKTVMLILDRSRQPNWSLSPGTNSWCDFSVDHWNVIRGIYISRQFGVSPPNSPFSEFRMKDYSCILFVAGRVSITNTNGATTTYSGTALYSYYYCYSYKCWSASTHQVSRYAEEQLARCKALHKHFFYSRFLFWVVVVKLTANKSTQYD